MSIHQVVNLRARCPIAFGDDESRERWFARVERQRASQRWRFVVAPDCSVTLPNGAVVRAGARVRLDDFKGSSMATWQLLQQAVRNGLVIDRDDRDGDDPSDDGPQAA